MDKNTTITLPFAEWSAKGFTINKGSKSTGKNKNGESLFTNEQVHKRKVYPLNKPKGYGSGNGVWTDADYDAYEHF